MKQKKKSSTKLSQVYQCTGCDSFWLNPLCKATETKNGNWKFTPSILSLNSTKCNECNHSLKIGGPIWSKPMNDCDLIKRMIVHLQKESIIYNQSKKILGMLNAVKDELSDIPLYFTLNSMSNTLHVTTPSMLEFRSALLHRGFRISNSHCNPNAIKTDAPNDVVWDIMRCWCKLHPSKHRSPNSPGFSIVSKDSSFEADFSTHKDAVLERIPKFHPNPQPNWGPGSKASGGKKE